MNSSISQIEVGLEERYGLIALVKLAERALSLSRQARQTPTDPRFARLRRPLARIEKTIQLIRQHLFILPDMEGQARSVSRELHHALSELCEQLERIVADAKTHPRSDISDSEFAELHDRVAQIWPRLSEMHKRLTAASFAISASDATLAQRAELDSLRVQLALAVDDAETASSALRDQVRDVASTASVSAFADLRDNHKLYEKRYGIAVIASLVLAVVVVLVVYFSSLSVDAYNPEIIAFILHNVLLLSGAGVLVRALLTKYNLERNLRILYDHRISVLQQYNIFEAAISSQNEAEKDKLRLEIMKYVFSDPQTGYTSERSADFNFTPIVQVVESLTKKS